MADETTSAAQESALDVLMTKGKLARDENQRPFARNLVTEFVNQVLEQGTVASNDTVAFINQRILELDDLITNQLNQIMHEPAFQKLEGSWRGLSYLVMNTETAVHLKLRLMNITKKELLDDLEKAVEFDQSQMFKKIYEEEYGTFGGHPYSCLIGDYEFTRHPQDMELLQKMSQVAAAAHAPFLTAADPKLFDLDSFEHLGVPRDLAKIFESLEMIKWNSFRETEDSRYVAMLLPRVLMRLPYGANTLPAEGLNFEEDVSGANTSKFCWTNPAYILGERITNAFSHYKWTAAIRGVEGGGIVEGLPAYTFKTTDGDIALKCPTETAITDRREKELSDLGLPYILAASRFAHYIKVIMRDKIGSFLTRENVEKYLNTWIASYVVLNDNASQAVKSKFPLREARIDVYEVPGKPGSYRSVVYLRPHFQMEELTASIRMVATLPPPAAQ
jgi:type VI secretion system protein ImpC